MVCVVRFRLLIWRSLYRCVDDRLEMALASMQMEWVHY